MVFGSVLTYIFAPNACHRYVGYMEEEAVHTYTACLRQMDAGHLPEWCAPPWRARPGPLTDACRAHRPAPGIAIDYWRLPQDATMRAVVAAVRSDETTHRFVNHSLANLDTSADVNPFALREPDMFLKGAKIEYVRVPTLSHLALMPGQV
jgi:ubiquinol oxidase